MEKYNICGFDKEQELNDLHEHDYKNSCGYCPKCGSNDLRYEKQPYFNG